tara:strand:+ start:707 stop:1144 length:438 start_codon:yes stop_codon:yes gene_type:complete
MDNDTEIFAGKTFSSLAKDIYFNSKTKSGQIEQLIKDLRTMIKDAGSATVIAPMIKDYLDVSIKNDDQLVKLSAVLQRYINGASGGDDNTSGGGGLTDSEKEELLNSVKNSMEDIQSDETTITSNLDSIIKKDSTGGTHKDKSSK